MSKAPKMEQKEPLEVTEHRRARQALRAAQEAEIRRLAREGGGVVMPESVVEAARDPGSVLHDEFTWDDADAAHAHRLQQARGLIQVFVRCLPSSSTPVRCFVALDSDRADGGGYRSIETVLSHTQRRAELLRMALRDAEHFQKRYETLTEADAVRAALREFVNVKARK